MTVVVSGGRGGANQAIRGHRANRVACLLIQRQQETKKSLHRQALELLGSGREEEAEACYRKLLKLDPQDLKSRLALGRLYHRSSRHREASEIVASVLDLDPSNAEALYLWGSLMQETSRRVATCQDNPLSGWEWLEGNDCGKSSSVPRFNLLILRHQLDSALRELEKSVELTPEDPALLEKLAFVLEKKGHLARADLHSGLAHYLRGNWKRAVSRLGKFLQTERGEPGHYVKVAKCCERLEWHDRLIEICRAGIRAYPETSELHFYLSLGLQRAGFTEQALALAEDASRRFPTDLRHKIHAKLFLPSICDSSKESENYLARFGKGLKSLLEDDSFEDLQTARQALLAMQRPYRNYLPYQEMDILPMQRAVGKFLQRIIAAQHPERLRPPVGAGWQTGGRIRVGYLSGYLGNSAGSYWLMGWLLGRCHSDFEVFCYHLSSLSDFMTGEFKRWSDRFRQLPAGDLDQSYRQIVSDQLHVLVFLDHHEYSLTTLLASYRLAPIQCAGWGYPFTSGLPTMDYYLSADLMEPSDGEAHYSEQLVRLPHLGVSCPDPIVPDPPNERRSFQFREDAVVYLSLQSIYKYLPQHDHLFASIARRVPRAQFAFLQNSSQNLNRRFRERLSRAFAAQQLDWDDYCVFVPVLDNWEEYMRRNQAGDIFLDTMGWSGCVSTLDAVACGLPVVTSPGLFRRSRQSCAILQLLGVTDTIGRDEEAYVEIAVRLGLDSKWRHLISARIRDNVGRVWNDRACVEALEAFYRKAVATWRTSVKGSKPSRPSGGKTPPLGRSQ